MCSYITLYITLILPYIPYIPISSRSSCDAHTLTSLTDALLPHQPTQQTANSPCLNDVSPTPDSSRILFATWWLFITIVTSFYTANLTAYLTFNSLVLPIEKAEDLARDPDIKWAAFRDGALADIIMVGAGYGVWGMGVLSWGYGVLGHHHGVWSIGHGVYGV